jgi:hypothetical protein
MVNNCSRKLKDAAGMMLAKDMIQVENGEFE